MSAADPQSLVGTTVLSDLRVDGLVHADSALATYEATSQPEGLVCSLRVALGIQVPEERQASVVAAAQRIARYAVGNRALCAPRSAGAVLLGTERRLALAHVGSPLESAEQKIKQGPALSLKEVIALLEPVAAALETLQDQGLVHGALHAGAVNLRPEGPVLSAFGLSELAILLGGASAGRDVVPPRYRVPEQVGIVPASPTHESDLYALALLATELLIGRPFTAETDTSSIARAIDHPMVRPTPGALGVALPEHLEKLFGLALRAQPRERTLSPKAFVTGLAAPPPVAPSQPKEVAPKSERTIGAEAPSFARHESTARSEAERPAKPSRFQPPAPAPQQQPRAESALWLVYALVILGILLLVGGAATIFVLAQRRVPAVIPIASGTILRPPPPPPATAPPEPEPPQSAEPVPPPAVSSPTPRPTDSSTTPKIPLASGLQLYPDDLTALVPLGKDTPLLGSRDALVTVVLFADMQCQHTRQARTVLEALWRRYDTDLRIAIRHLPIPSHDKAEAAAEIAATAGALGGPAVFWKLFGTLTANQGALANEDMLLWAEQAGAPSAALRRALEEHVYVRIVDADRAIAQRLMVRATPTFFINGKRANGEHTQAKLADLIDKELGFARAALASGTPRAKLYATRVQFNVTSGEADPPRPTTPRRRP